MQNSVAEIYQNIRRTKIKVMFVPWYSRTNRLFPTVLEDTFTETDTAPYSRVSSSEQLLKKFLYLRKMFTHASRTTHADLKITLTILIYIYSFPSFLKGT